MTQLRDVAIVGAGLLGLAAGRVLAARGYDVVVLEQAEVGHPGSGSKGKCRIFRLGYPDPSYVRAARRSAELWHELEAESGCQILWPTPQLTLGAGLRSVRAAMAAAGAPCDLLTAAEAADRFPAVRTGGSALLEPDSAVIAADTALAALAAGVPDLRTSVRVLSLADKGDQVLLRTSAGPVCARTAIVTAGPWSGGLLASLSVPLPGRPTLEQVSYLRPVSHHGTGPNETGQSGTGTGQSGTGYGGARRDEAGANGGSPGGASPGGARAGQASTGRARTGQASPGGTSTVSSAPIFLCHTDRSPYGLPVPGSVLYKIGIHPSGPAIDPEVQDQSPDQRLAGQLADAARRYLPGYDPEPVSTERCVYDNSPDEDFVLDRVGNVVIGSGTSGHGFKFGPLLGEWLADLATATTGQAGEMDAGLRERFAIGRFRPGHDGR
jgi:sarcosine oxidase